MELDPALCAAVKGEGAGPALESLAHWLLRSTERKASTGEQLGYWFAQAAAGAGAYRAESCDALRALGKICDADLLGAAERLARPARYQRLVPAPNPQAAITFGAGECAKRVASLGPRPHAPAAEFGAFADGYRYDKQYLYWSMPLRGAFVRAALEGAGISRGMFARLLDLAPRAVCELPFVPDARPRGEELLGFVLTEALDDRFYVERVVDAGGGLSVPFGVELFAKVREVIMPPDGNDPDALAALTSFARARAAHPYGYRVEHGELVVTVGHPDGFEDHPFAAIIVPSYSPLGAREPLRVLDPVCEDRVKRAHRDHRAGLAPFILVSGGSIYPMGTPSNDAKMMREKLLELGVPSDRILVDARARHSTTNLRNAGRLLRAYGLAGPALITTRGPSFPIIGDAFDQDYYFAHPGFFRARCDRELGYRVDAWLGSLAAFRTAQHSAAHAVVQGTGAFTQDLARALRFRALLERTHSVTHTVLVPSATACERYGLRDPLDP